LTLRDELGTFVKQKANRPWIWIAMDATTRQIIAFHVGDCRREGAQALWAEIPAVYREQATLPTDPYEPYTGVMPADRHTAITTKARKPKPLERFNNTRLGGLVPLMALGTILLLLPSCVLDVIRPSKDWPKPTVKFATPAAWGCAHQTQTLQTPKGTLEACTVCQNIARTGQGVTINKEAHTVPPQGRVAMCESSAFVTAE
jgi:IS1 family transposase